MAKHVLKNAYVAVNGTDLSAHARSVTVTTSRPEVDVTAMGAAFQEILAGIGTASIEVEFYNDYAAGKVYATLWPLATSDTPFTVAVRAVNATISATNPEFQMSALLLDFNPLAGAVGEANMTTVTFSNASQTGLVADITP
jgi:hypothetical protein